MTPTQKLHTAARRYCQAQSNYWYEHATELRETKPRDPNRYQQKLLDSYARSNVLMMICTEIERLDPDGLDSLENNRDHILHSGRTAQAPSLRPNMGQASMPQVVQPTFGINTDNAIAGERKAFCTYIQELTDSQLNTVQPLPYQRVLAPNESSARWKQLHSRWQIIGEHWYPLSKCQLPNVTAFNTDAFEKGCSSNSLVDMLSAHGVSRIWELREYGIEYEQDVSCFDPAFNGYEGYWTSKHLDWIVYASHEASVTVGGWLLENIKAQWPAWETHTW